MLYSADAIVEAVEIPNRPAFRAQDVCELAGLQPYVLRTWEAEFPDLGVAKAPHGPRVYRRADVERVLLIKHLLFVDGLTLAGVRRRLSEQGLLPTSAPDNDVDVGALADATLRQGLQHVRRELHWMLEVLSHGATASAAPDHRPVAAKSRPRARAVNKKPTVPAKSSKGGKTRRK